MVRKRSGKRLLVTGASGFLGWNLCRIARERYRVTGVYHLHNCEIPGVTCIACDCTDMHAIEALFDRIRPDAVIHTAAAADPNYCQINVKESAAINVDASAAIARQCGRLNIPCVFTSSDLVFGGGKAPYREEDTVCPLNRYGVQKAAAEQGMAAAYPRTIICRMPLMYGDAPPHAKSFIQPMIAAMLDGRELPLFIDEYRTPVSATDAAQGLLLSVEKAPPGILHLGGPERLSRYKMGLLLSETLDLKPILKKCLQREVLMTAPRAADASLDSSKAGLLGFVPGRMREELGKLECVRKRLR